MNAQQRDALELANQVRISNGVLKKEIQKAPPAQSRKQAAEVVKTATREDFAGRIPVITLLRSINRAGDARAYRWIADAGIVQSRKVGALSPRQRVALAALLLEDAERITTTKGANHGN